MKSIYIKVRNGLLTSLIVVILLFTVISVFFIYFQNRSFSGLLEEYGAKLENFANNAIYGNIDRYVSDITSSCGIIIENNYQNNIDKANSVADFCMDLYEKGNIDTTQGDSLIGTAIMNNETDEWKQDLYILGDVREFIKCIPGYIGSDLSYYDVFVLTESGMVLDGTDTYWGNDYPDARNEDWYIKAKETRQPFWTDVIYGIATGAAKIQYVVPLIYEDEFKGVVVSAAPLEEMNTTLLNIDFAGLVDIVLLDSNGNVILGSNEYDVTNAKNTNVIMFDGDYCIKRYSMQVSDDSVYFVFNMSKAIAAAENAKTEMGSLSKSVNKSTLIAVIAAIAVFILIAVIFAYAAFRISKRFASRISNPILALSKNVEAFGKGDMDVKLDSGILNSNDEVGLLAQKFAAMSDDIKNYVEKITKITTEQERFKMEMEAAESIQLSLMSQDFPKSDEYSVFAFMKAARSVGGDLYAFFKTDDDHLLVAVADVAGKGIPASLFSVRTKVYIQIFGEMGLTPSQILEKVNENLCQNNDESVFVTAFLGILDIKTGGFSYANAGHNKPVAIGKTTHWLSCVNSLPLGCMEGIKYKDEFLQLSKDESVFIYSDGVTEAIGRDKSFYGDNRLLEKLSGIGMDKGSEDILRAVLDDLKEHIGDEEQSDDITMLIVKFEGLE